jgi:hypothetical protein
MSWLLQLKLIPLFNFYLALTLFASTALRMRQYWAVIHLVRTFGGRWPRLLKLVSAHRSVLITWGTVLPLVVSLGMLVIQMLASRLVFPQAHLAVDQLLDSWVACSVVAVCGAAMVAFDVWGIFDVGEVDRRELEKYFDQAEYWLRSWAAPMVRIFTFGWIHPRRMVAKEVQSALVSASEMLNYNLWWIAAQAGLRLLFGGALWVSWAWLG